MKIAELATHSASVGAQLAIGILSSADKERGARRKASLLKALCSVHIAARREGSAKQEPLAIDRPRRCYASLGAPARQSILQVSHRVGQLHAQHNALTTLKFHLQPHKR